MTKISKEQIFPLLVEASPGFAPEWNAFQREWKDDEMGFPYYVCLGSFANYIVEKFEKNDRADFSAIFSVIERFHVEGDAYVREAATIGILEGIQNRAGQDGMHLDLYLLPESKFWWEKLKDFWERGILLREEVQATK